jgi:hypothetical protein
VKHVVFITPECLERLKKSPEDLPIGNGDEVRLIYVTDESQKKALQSAAKGSGCYLGEALP